MRDPDRLDENAPGVACSRLLQPTSSSSYENVARFIICASVGMDTFTKHSLNAAVGAVGHAFAHGSDEYRHQKYGSSAPKWCTGDIDWILYSGQLPTSRRECGHLVAAAVPGHLGAPPWRRSYLACVVGQAPAGAAGLCQSVGCDGEDCGCESKPPSV